MKDKGISRNVGAGSRRPPVDGPGLDKFSRTGGSASPETGGADDASPKGERRRRRVHEDGRHFKELDEKRMKSAVMTWTMLLGGAGVAVVVVFVVFGAMRQTADKNETTARMPKMDYVPVEKPVEKKALGDAEAIALAKRAMAARTEEEVLAIIDPGTEPVGHVVDFLRSFEEKEGAITGYNWMASLDTRREDVTGVVVSTVKDGQKGNRIAMFASDGDGQWKMDFPAFARLATPSWNELLDGKVQQAVVRVYVERDQYFNGAFSEADGWICCGVASPDVEKLLFGYCKKDSPQAEALRTLLESRKMARATVVLERPEGSDGRQFVIKRVLAADWLVGDEAADSKGN